MTIDVSILTHLVGWVQPGHLRPEGAPSRAVSILTHLVGWVQRPECRTCQWQGVWFQSSPTWSGGCNPTDRAEHQRTVTVSILTHLVGWVQQPRQPVKVQPESSVSILTHLVGWVQQGWEVCVRLLSPVFGY